MFQYAFGRAISLKTNQQLCLDLSWFSQGNREYGLTHCHIPGDVMCDVEMPKSMNRNRNILLKILDKTAGEKLWNLLNSYGLFMYYGLGYKEPIMYDLKNYYISGYWQSERYFVDYARIIRNELVITGSDKIKELNHKIKNEKKSIAIHYRRGDYINNKGLGICRDDYYFRAIERMKYEVDNPIFFVFSDDTDYVKTLFCKTPNIEIVESNSDDYDDFVLMSSCKNFIISNSTYSWWAQYLSDYSDKCVIAPNKWFNGKRTAIYQNDWIEITV